MNHLLHVIRSSSAVAIAGFFLVCSGAAAGTLSKPVTLNPDAVVHAEASRDSATVGIIDRDALYYVQMELVNSSGRWCAIRDGTDAFVGYALCGQLVPQKKQLLKQDVSGKSANGGKAGKKKGEGASGQESRAGDDGLGSSGRIFASILFVSAVILLTITLFLAALLSGYLVYRYRGNRQEQDGLEGEPRDYRGVNGGQPAASEERQAAHSHITTAPPAGVGNLVKCQLCGVIQILGYDSKCISCRAMITYCIKVGEKTASAPSGTAPPGSEPDRDR